MKFECWAGRLVAGAFVVVGGLGLSIFVAGSVQAAPEAPGAVECPRSAKAGRCGIGDRQIRFVHERRRRFSRSRC